ncbi:MAG: acyl-CoA dehydrogenase family protein [Xanthomonadales bacterium]
MALVLNEEQLMLKESTKGFLQQRAPVSHLRELRDNDSDKDHERGYSKELWTEMAEMGWTAILVPEQYGGLEYGYSGLGIVLEETGRTLTPSPLLSTCLMGVTALVRGGSTEQCGKYLPEVASGSHLLALAVNESSLHAPYSVSTTAQSNGDGFCLAGRKSAVVDGHNADTLIVSARTRGTEQDWDGISLFLVPADHPGVSIERYRVLDTHCAAHITLENVEVGPDSLLGELHQGAAILDAVLDAGAIGQSAELLGLAREAFERTLEYLKERKQFGVPIGSFQALQHRAAMMFGEIEQCKSIVLKGLRALDRNDENMSELASLVKAKLSETAHNVAAEAIQMHGGIGMTDEFDIGFFLKRCRILETFLGDRYYHLDRFARQRGY